MGLTISMVTKEKKLPFFLAEAMKTRTALETVPAKQKMISAVKSVLHPVFSASFLMQLPVR